MAKRKSKLKKTRKYIVAVPSAYLREEPNGKVVAIVKFGRELNVLEIVNGWAACTDLDGCFIKEDLITCVEIEENIDEHNSEE